MTRFGLFGCAVAMLTFGCGGGRVGSDGAVGGEDGSVVGPPALPAPSPSALPVGPTDVVRVGPGRMRDQASALSLGSDGSLRYAFETDDQSGGGAELWIASSADAAHVALPQPFGFTDRMLEAMPSYAGEELYFWAGDDPTAPPTLYRADQLAPTALPAIDGVSSFAARPRLAAVSVGLAVAFVDAGGQAMLTLGADASSFETPRTVSSGATRAVVAGFGDGSLAYAVEDAAGVSVRRSPDGVSFTDPATVNDAGHDPALVRRADGGLDVYYVASGLLQRRALMPDGTMGVGGAGHLRCLRAADPAVRHPAAGRSRAGLVRRDPGSDAAGAHAGLAALRGARALKRGRTSGGRCAFVTALARLPTP